jgi:hypothetical protein
VTTPTPAAASAEIDFNEFVSWWTSDSTAKNVGSVAAQLAEKRDAVASPSLLARGDTVILHCSSLAVIPYGFIDSY